MDEVPSPDPEITALSQSLFVPKLEPLKLGSSENKINLY